MQRYRIGVVGMGMAGATVSHLLARLGHRVTVLEQAVRLSPIGAGVILQPSGQAVLERLGVREAVQARAAPIDELHVRHRDGRTLLRSQYGDYAPGCRAYGIHRGVLFQAVYALARESGVTIHPSCEIVRREIRPNGEVFLQDGCGQMHGPFDFILGTDGARSRLRDACQLPAFITPYNYGAFWAITPGTGIPGKLLQVVGGNRWLFGLVPLGEGLVTIYWGVRLQDYEAVRTRGLEALKDEIRAFCPESDAVLEHLFDWDQLLFTTYQHVSQRRWYDAHTLFLGDACHAMSPHLGQGINIALLDAWYFARALHSAPTPHAAFAAYWRVRRVNVNYYATITYLLSPFFQSDWSLLGWGRDWVLPLLPHLPWVKRQMLLTMCGLKGGLLRGPLSL